jgi:hypothetical protein
MSIYLGNTFIGNGNYLGNLNIPDARIFVPVPLNIQVQYLVVGGGGNGATANTFDVDAFDKAGGGGAGGFKSGSLAITSSAAISVYVGPGAPRLTALNSNGNNGTGSFFGSISVDGGGGGGYKQNGLDGASGGGGGISGTGATAYGGGTGISGQGFNGGTAYRAGTCPGGSCVLKAGPGGGAASTGSATATVWREGQPKQWLDGFYYSRGGYVAGMDASLTSSLAGNGGTGRTDSAAGTEGDNGIVKVRYLGSDILFTGGTTAISGGYVYHTFTTGSSSFQYIGT